MYEKYELEIIHYEKNIFVVASGVDEGGGRGEDMPVEDDD